MSCLLLSSSCSSIATFQPPNNSTMATSTLLLRRLTTTPRLLRSFVTATPVSLDNLPYHIVVGMPALSPTMESGSLAEWYVAEGDAFAAGDALAKIETDKASIDFEAQDDGYVAKLLKEAGDGADIVVGTPILVTVEEEDAVGAFRDFVVVAEEVSAPAPAPVVEEPVVEAAAPDPVAAAAPPPAPVAAPVTAAPPPTPPPSSGGATWASLPFASPLLATLAKEQQAFVDKYGTTGQKPLA